MLDLHFLSADFVHVNGAKRNQLFAFYSCLLMSNPFILEFGWLKHG